VTYYHHDVGADNNGLRTGPLMEGACYAFLTWGEPAHERLLREMVRGFSSWILAMETQPDDTPVLLSRAAYPVNIQSEDHGVSYLIDYGANRPGVDNSATEYVHLAANPHWGDIWIKNKRSKDCIGQMHRAMGQILSCRDHVSAATRDDIDEMWELYAAWSRQVEDDG